MGDGRELSEIASLLFFFFVFEILFFLLPLIGFGSDSGGGVARRKTRFDAAARAAEPRRCRSLTVLDLKSRCVAPARRQVAASGNVSKGQKYFFQKKKKKKKQAGGFDLQKSSWQPRVGRHARRAARQQRARTRLQHCDLVGFGGWGVTQI